MSIFITRHGNNKLGGVCLPKSTLILVSKFYRYVPNSRSIRMSLYFRECDFCGLVDNELINSAWDPHSGDTIAIPHWSVKMERAPFTKDDRIIFCTKCEAAYLEEYNSLALYLRFKEAAIAYTTIKMAREVSRLKRELEKIIQPPTKLEIDLHEEEQKTPEPVLTEVDTTPKRCFAQIPDFDPYQRHPRQAPYEDTQTLSQEFFDLHHEIATILASTQE